MTEHKGYQVLGGTAKTFVCSSFTRLHRPPDGIRARAPRGPVSLMKSLFARQSFELNKLIYHAFYHWSAIKSFIALEATQNRALYMPNIELHEKARVRPCRRTRRLPSEIDDREKGNRRLYRGAGLSFGPYPQFTHREPRLGFLSVRQ
jgi:hypothetical protein